MHFAFSARDVAVAFMMATAFATASTAVPTVEAAEKLYYMHTDHLGSTVLITDQSGLVVETNDYFPFGSGRIEEDGGAGVKNDKKYTGQEKDLESGLYYYNARYYQPDLGRFASQDILDGEIAKPQSLNKYAYTVNNPIKYVDPSGETPYEFYTGLGAGFGKSLFDTAEALGNTAMHPIRALEGIGQFAADLTDEVGYTALNPKQAFSSAVDGYRMQIEEIGRGYWNANDYERGKFAGGLIEKGVEAYGLGKAGTSVLRVNKFGNIQTVNVDEVLTKKSKYKHIFGDAGHNLNVLGTPQQAMQKVSKALLHADKAGLMPKTGNFEVIRKIGGNNVTIRGSMANGEARIGTMFIKK